MKAAVIREYGGPEVIHYEDVPSPELKDDDVLIKVAASSFNPVDAGIRSGLFQAMFPVKFPYTLGLDVSGVVEKAGSAVTNLRVGDRVFSYVDLSRNGAAAQYVAAKASEVAIAPITIALSDAGSLPAVALTAWQALFVHANLQPGQRVLITAAAGGVGVIAVQLAKWRGAHVIGTASPKRFDLLRQLGVDEPIDYSQEYASAIARPLDVIFNVAPPSVPVDHLLNHLNPGGILVSASKPADAAAAERLGVRTMRMASQRNAAQLSEIAKLVDQGALKPVITERVPVADASEAHRQAGRTYGKVLLVADETLK